VKVEVGWGSIIWSTLPQLSYWKQGRRAGGSQSGSDFWDCDCTPTSVQGYPIAWLDSCEIAGMNRMDECYVIAGAPCTFATV